MQADFRKFLLAAVMMATAPPACADVITEWNDTAVALVTPAMLRVRVSVQMRDWMSGTTAPKIPSITPECQAPASCYC